MTQGVIAKTGQAEDIANVALFLGFADSEARTFCSSLYYFIEQ